MCVGVEYVHKLVCVGFVCIYVHTYVYVQCIQRGSLSLFLSLPPSFPPSPSPSPPPSLSPQTTDLHLMETYKSKLDRFALSSGPPTTAHYLYVLQPLDPASTVKEAWISVIRSMVRLGARGTYVPTFSLLSVCTT